VVRLQVPQSLSDLPEGPVQLRHILPLGFGGMAEVELALRTCPGQLKKLVVLKRIRADLRGDPAVTAMFLSEARLATRMSHPNVVHTYEAGSDGSGLYLVMEYLEGQSYAKIRPELIQSPHRIADSLVILSEVLNALEYAHTLKDIDGKPLNIVHRDVSPSNIFVTYHGQVKLLDFGVATTTSPDLPTRRGTITGKVRYMAPEQARGEPSDARADLYSVGVLLWEALCGVPLWGGTSSASVLERVATDNMPTLENASFANMPPRVAEICDKALQADAKQRFATAREMREALEEIIALLAPGASSRALGRHVYEMFHEEALELETRIETEVRNLPMRARTLCGIGPNTQAPQVQEAEPEPEASGTSFEDESSNEEVDVDVKVTLAEFDPDAPTSAFLLADGEVKAVQPQPLKTLRSSSISVTPLPARNVMLRNVAVGFAVAACSFLLVLAAAKLLVRPKQAAPVEVVQPAARVERSVPVESPEPEPSETALAAPPTSAPSAVQETPERALSSTTTTSKKRARSAATYVRPPAPAPVREPVPAPAAKPSPNRVLEIDRDSPWNKP
jgi:serine/threonine protein kinase